MNKLLARVWRRKPGLCKRTVVSTHLSKMLTDRAVAETDEPILHVTMVLGNRIKGEKQRRAGREGRTWRVNGALRIVKFVFLCSLQFIRPTTKCSASERYFFDSTPANQICQRNIPDP